MPPQKQQITCPAWQFGESDDDLTGLQKKSNSLASSSFLLFRAISLCISISSSLSNTGFKSANGSNNRLHDASVLFEPFSLTIQLQLSLWMTRHLVHKWRQFPRRLLPWRSLSWPWRSYRSWRWRPGRRQGAAGAGLGGRPWWWRRRRGSRAAGGTPSSWTSRWVESLGLGRSHHSWELGIKSLIHAYILYLSCHYKFWSSRTFITHLDLVQKYLGKILRYEL